MNEPNFVVTPWLAREVQHRRNHRNLLTRAHGKTLLLCPRPRTERFKNSAVYTTAKCWNELSLDEQRASSYNSFKLKTKKREFEKLLAT